jgi:hypothetical protein
MPMSPSPASAADANLAITAYFSVHACAEPGVMPRALELFAKRGLVPSAWHSTVTGADLTITIEMGGLDREVTRYIAACLRQIAYVETVLTAENMAVPAERHAG